MSRPTPVIVLVETAGTANLGAVARCAAAYGIPDLRLVNPQCEVDETSLMWACYGKRVLDERKTYETLEAALEGTGLAVAFTRREGKRRHRHHTLAQFCQEVLPNYESSLPLALVFGNEESGLANHHLAACHRFAEIPVVSEDGSLNLSHAVAVGLYEIVGRETSTQPPEPGSPMEEPVDALLLQQILERSTETLQMAGYPHHRGVLEEEVTKLKDIVLRSSLQSWEAGLLLGMLKQVAYRLKHGK